MKIKDLMKNVKFRRQNYDSILNRMLKKHTRDIEDALLQFHDTPETYQTAEFILQIMLSISIKHIEKLIEWFKNGEILPESLLYSKEYRDDLKNKLDRFEYLHGENAIEKLANIKELEQGLRPKIVK